MGAGYYGGFGHTDGAKRKLNAVSLSSVFVGKGKGENLKKAAKWIKEEKGFTDVIIHGAPNNAFMMVKGKWEPLNQRQLSKMIKKDSGYKKGAIRLVSCSTGQHESGFAQNLANKMGVPVKAPTDTLWILPTGEMVIGKSQFSNTGKWKTYYPGGNKK